MKHIPYPSIEQFRNAIHKIGCKARHAGVDVNGDPVYDHTKVLPVLTYEGTVKLHGTNAAIGINCKTGELWFQSRENVITLEKDNAGFVRHFHEFDRSIFSRLLNLMPLGYSGGTTGFQCFNDGKEVENIVIFGEWCGGSIQPNVGIAKLSKRFVVFGVLADNVWLSKYYVKELKNESIGVYNIYDYACESIEINFNKPEIAQNKLSELTIKVEESCPVAKAMGVDGVGEGIVWKCITEGWESPEFYFKVKGEKHSASKVKTLAAVDVELVASQREFAEKTVTENRCRQGIDKLREAGKKLDRTSVGDFIKWVVADVEKEESDTAKASGLDIKKASGELTKAARMWFFKNELTF
jgi:hypothetical protein